MAEPSVLSPNRPVKRNKKKKMTPEARIARQQQRDDLRSIMASWQTRRSTFDERKLDFEKKFRDFAKERRQAEKETMDLREEHRLQRLRRIHGNDFGRSTPNPYHTSLFIPDRRNGNNNALTSTSTNEIGDDDDVYAEDFSRPPGRRSSTTSQNSLSEEGRKRRNSATARSIQQRQQMLLEQEQRGIFDAQTRDSARNFAYTSEVLTHICDTILLSGSHITYLSPRVKFPFIDRTRLYENVRRLSGPIDDSTARRVVDILYPAEVERDWCCVDIRRRLEELLALYRREIVLEIYYTLFLGQPLWTLKTTPGPVTRHSLELRVDETRSTGPHGASQVLESFVYNHFEDVDVRASAQHGAFFTSFVDEMSTNSTLASSMFGFVIAAIDERVTRDREARESQGNGEAAARFRDNVLEMENTLRRRNCLPALDEVGRV